jgi:hypothetical protein
LGIVCSCDEKARHFMESTAFESMFVQKKAPAAAAAGAFD